MNRLRKLLVSVTAIFICLALVAMLPTPSFNASAQTAISDFSGLIGGDGTDSLTLAAVDNSGNFYLIGSTSSTNFPTINSAQNRNRGGNDAVVVKLSPQGNIIYSTYLGGKNEDSIRRVQVGNDGSIYLLGQTNSPDLLVSNALQSTYARKKQDALFVARLTSDGQMVFLTYLGRGGDAGDISAFLLDPQGNVVLVGLTSANNFPVASAFQAKFGNQDGTPSSEDDVFITRLNGSGQAIFSTYLGGRGSEELLGARLDAAGNIYVVGNTLAKNFPKSNSFQRKFGGAKDGFVAKFSPQGQAVYSTFLGGSAQDEIRDFNVDSAGNVVVAGRTGSQNFPVMNAAQSQSGGFDDIFVTRLNPSGTPAYSTYLGGGGQEIINLIDLKLGVDSSGNAFVTGTTNSRNFPLVNAFQNAYRDNVDTVVAGFNTSGQLLYSSYLGGGLAESPTRAIVDAGGNLYVTGTTRSTDLPVVSALQPRISGNESLYVAKILPNGTAVYVTYLGGNVGQELIHFVVDNAGQAYLVGRTRAIDFPTVNAFQPNSGGGFGAFFDVFVTKLGSNGGAVYSTYLGGSRDENDATVGQFAIDNQGNAYLSGITSSPDFPTRNAIQPTLRGDSDGYLTKLDASGNLVFSTFLGGSSNESTTALRLASDGTIFLSGISGSIDFPSVDSTLTYGGGSQDGFLIVIRQ